MAQVTLRDYLQETEDAISTGRVDDAFTHCQNILAQFPDSLEAQRLLGEAYLAQGRLEEAQQSFDWVLTNDPENVVAYCDRALISEGASDYDTALDCYQQAYELSRGNSQIRQEFNRLSAQAGQQGFMFSRAGLARLYMRGDLLTQAIQEWEAVLATNPDRLDACTGLLETCWREGLYDRVEQLANQVLQDVPTCLKALLLLAHVSSAKNMQQAQELIKRAEALDPDLLMAQDLFSDLMAKQLAEPFLYLLKKAPASIDMSLPQSAQVPVATQEEVVASYVPASPLPSEALATWDAHTNWNNEAASVNSMQERLAAQDSSALPMWPADADPTDSVWGEPEGSQAANSQQALPDFITQLGADTKNTNLWSMPQDQPVPSIQTSSSLPPVQQEEQSLEVQLPEPSLSMSEEDNQLSTEASPWETSSLHDSYKEPIFSETDGWENTHIPAGESGIWTSLAREDAPPAWMNMLTQNEKRQLGDERSTPSLAEEPASIAQSQTQEEAPQSIPMPISDDNEPFSFGPEWLKSLGATSIDASAEDVSTHSFQPEAKRPLVPAPQAYELPPVYEEPVVQVMPTYEPWSEPVAEAQDMAERNLLTTLEELESDLRSKGFVPLEPNSLSVIAQTQEPVSPINAPTPEPVPHEENIYESLPSALAELGSFIQQPSRTVNPSAMPVASVPPIQVTPTVLPEEPAWLTSLNTISTPGSVAASQVGQHMQENAQTQSTPSAWPVRNAPPQISEEEDALAGSLSSATQPTILQPQETIPAYPPAIAARVGVGTPTWQPSVVDNNALLNSELETTMKRPAVRLQPMSQQRSSMQKDSVPLQARSRTPEQPPARNAMGGNLNAQERLLKGYHYQLVGDYDEAMQEYRIVIRSTPELLGEVVSNVRALLKIAPKYSTGYRILGDAYMRQGEYLQAMEAYNKALTMAKKAKG